MENTGFMGLLVTLYQRVILSYKSTLLGIAVVAGSVVADALVASPNKLLSVLGAVVGAALVLIKERVKVPPVDGSLSGS